MSRNRGEIKVWITVPTKYLKSSDRTDFLDHKLLPDFRELRSSLHNIGFGTVKFNWFDPINEDFCSGHKRMIEEADILLFYLDAGRSSYFGKGACRIYKQNEDKPRYIMYRTKSTSELKYYVPHLQSGVDYEDWHRFKEVQFGMPRSIDWIVAEMEADDKSYIDASEAFASVPSQKTSRWIYLYTSIYGDSHG